ncbi:hypothetical protein [Paenibacillus sp. SI8]|uniref:hypothetical protein n=1 Tax=unclassified Paenibacillus TaxID=185978 RepID=UPI0034657582
MIKTKFGKNRILLSLVLALVMAFCIIPAASANGGTDITYPDGFVFYGSTPPHITWNQATGTIGYQIAITNLNGGFVYNSGFQTTSSSLTSGYYIIPASVRSTMNKGSYVVYLETYHSGGYYSDQAFFGIQ